MKRIFLSLIFAIGLSGVTLQAADGRALKYSNSLAWFNHLMLWQHQRDDQRHEEFAQALQSPEKMQQYVASVQQKMQQLAGPMPERGELQSRVVGTVQGPGFYVEKVIFKSRPGHYVTAHLYLPGEAPVKTKRAKAPVAKIPACIEMCGHGLRGKGNSSGTAIQMALNGIAVMVVDPIGQGEMQQLIDAEGNNLTRGVTTEHTLLAPIYNLLGSSLESQIYFDNSRAIDYLCSRADIDPEHIGCYGFSGGGTEAAYLAVLDPRVQCVSVGLFFSDRTRTLETQGPSDGCQWIPGEGALGINHADMSLCMAPKPVQVLDGLFDFVDHYGALKGVREIEQAYSVLGVPERVQQYYSYDGHACPPDAMSRLVGWFRRWLANDESLPTIAEVRWSGKDMNCTQKGQTLLEYADCESTMQDALRQYDALRPVHESFRKAAPAEVRKTLLSCLCLDESLVTDKPLPVALPGTPLNADGTPLALACVQTRYTKGRDFQEYRYQLNRADQMPVSVIVRIPDAATPKSPVLVHLHQAGKEAFLADYDRQDMTTDGTIQVFADVRGVGEMLDPHQYNLTKYWNSEYRCAVLGLHENRPLMGQRVIDIHTLVNFCSTDSKLAGRSINIVADGLYGPVLMHAAVLDSRISHVTLSRSLKTWRSYLENPTQYDMYTNVLKGALLYYDLPDLIALSGGRVRFED